MEGEGNINTRCGTLPCSCGYWKTALIVLNGLLKINYWASIRLGSINALYQTVFRYDLIKKNRGKPPEIGPFHSFLSSKMVQIVRFVSNLSKLIQNGQFPCYINIFYCIDQLLFIVWRSIRGKPPLSTGRFDKLFVFWSINYRFQINSILSQEPGLYKFKNIGLY